MKNAVSSILVLVLIQFSPKVASGTGVIEELQRLRRIMTDCSMEYRMECNVAGQHRYEIRGRMAVQGNKYYDSSNARFAVFNDRWQILADHYNNTLTASFVPNIRKQLRGIGDPTVSAVLLSDELFLRNAKLQQTRRLGDTLWYRLKVDGQSLVQYVDFCMLRGFRILSYTAMIDYPLGGTDDNGNEQMLSIKFMARSLSFPAAASLFRSDRIISEAGRKVVLRRYGHYKNNLTGYQTALP